MAKCSECGKDFEPNKNGATSSTGPVCSRRGLSQAFGLSDSRADFTKAVDIATKGNESDLYKTIVENQAENVLEVFEDVNTIRKEKGLEEITFDPFKYLDTKAKIASQKANETKNDWKKVQKLGFSARTVLGGWNDNLLNSIDPVIKQSLGNKAIREMFDNASKFLKEDRELKEAKALKREAKNQATKRERLQKKKAEAYRKMMNKLCVSDEEIVRFVKGDRDIKRFIKNATISIIKGSVGYTFGNVPSALIKLSAGAFLSVGASVCPNRWIAGALNRTASKAFRDTEVLLVGKQISLGKKGKKKKKDKKTIARENDAKIRKMSTQELIKELSKPKNLKYVPRETIKRAIYAKRYCEERERALKEAKRKKAA